MKTGIELIAQERQEQVEKHGYDSEHDEVVNCAKELGYVAAMLVISEFEEGIDPNVYPENWDSGHVGSMLMKPYQERLIIAGALIAAELDRLNCSTK